MERKDLWQQRYSEQPQERPQPCQLLKEFSHLLPQKGQALDLACGRGGNALFLADRGLQTCTWDYAENAISALRAWQQPNLIAETRDVISQPPEPASFDVIVVSHFLERTLCPAISAALKPGGLLFYQTFTREKALPGGPNNPDFLLERNELLDLFADLTVRVYREEGTLGDPDQGIRNLAMLVAEK